MKGYGFTKSRRSNNNKSNVSGFYHVLISIIRMASTSFVLRLLDLPDDFWIGVCVDWLEIMTWKRNFDSAIANHTHRTRYLEMMKQPGCTVSIGPINSVFKWDVSEEVFSWAMKREVSFSVAQLTSNTVVELQHHKSVYENLTEIEFCQSDWDKDGLETFVLAFIPSEEEIMENVSVLLKLRRLTIKLSPILPPRIGIAILNEQFAQVVPVDLLESLTLIGWSDTMVLEISKVVPYLRTLSISNLTSTNQQFNVQAWTIEIIRNLENLTDVTIAMTENHEIFMVMLDILQHSSKVTKLEVGFPPSSSVLQLAGAEGTLYHYQAPDLTSSGFLKEIYTIRRVQLVSVTLNEVRAADVMHIANSCPKLRYFSVEFAEGMWFNALEYLGQILSGTMSDLHILGMGKSDQTTTSDLQKLFVDGGLFQNLTCLAIRDDSKALSTEIILGILSSMPLLKCITFSPSKLINVHLLSKSPRLDYMRNSGKAVTGRKFDISMFLKLQ